jgi:N-carbamoylputrescine amidase
MDFWGGSFVSDPFGVVLYQAPHDQEEVMVVELDLGKINETRIHWPFLRDRRIDSYDALTRRYLDE